jgi:hypothetical protein
VQADPSRVLRCFEAAATDRGNSPTLVSDHVLLQRLVQLLLNEEASETREAFFRRYIYGAAGWNFRHVHHQRYESGAVTLAHEFLKCEILIKRLTNRATEHLNEIIEIFNGLILSTVQFCEFLDELPVFSEEISIEFCSPLRKALSHFPTSVYKPPTRERCVISVTWNDSEGNGDA